MNQNAFGDLFGDDLPIPGAIAAAAFPRVADEAALHQNAHNTRLVQDGILFAHLDTAVPRANAFAEKVLDAGSQTPAIERRVESLNAFHRDRAVRIVMNADEDRVLVTVSDACPLLKGQPAIRPAGQHDVQALAFENLFQAFGSVQVEVLLLYPIALGAIIFAAVTGIDHHRAERHRGEGKQDEKQGGKRRPVVNHS